MFLILLAGAVNHKPVSQFYFLQAHTSGIPGAPTTSRWTYWNVCPVGANGRNNCGTVHPAFPLDPPSSRNFGTTTDVPHQFIGTSEYFYLTRFMFAFMLITLFFGVMSFFTGLLALCSRIGSYLSGLLIAIALFFQTLNAALMTQAASPLQAPPLANICYSAAYVIGRNNFRSNKQTANIGSYAFGFEWAAWGCFLISTVLFCIAGGSRKKDSTAYSSNRRSFFGGKRSKSSRSRGSFIDGDRKTYESA